MDEKSPLIALSEVQGLLEGYAPYFSLNELNSAQRGNFSGSIRHYDLLLHHLLNRHPPCGRSADHPRLLELGSRYGLFLDMLSKRGYKDVVGIDIDPGCVSVAKRHGLDLRRINAAHIGRKLAQGAFSSVFALRFFPIELKAFSRDQRRSRILGVLEDVHGCLKAGGTFFCDAEVPLPAARIEALGFRIESRLLRTKYHPMMKVRARSDVWVFEKK